MMSHHAKRLMEMISDRIMVDLADASFLRAQASSKIAEMIDRQRQVSRLGFANGLAIVDGLDQGEEIELLFDPVGDAQECLRALRRRGAAPSLPGGMRGIERQFDILRGGTGNRANHMTVDRRNILEFLTLDRGNPCAANKIVIMRSDRDLIGDVGQNLIDHACLPEFFQSPRRFPALPGFPGILG
jgi:hypothetical protein